MEMSKGTQQILLFIVENWKLVLFLNLLFYLYFYYTRTFDYFEKRNIKFMKPMIFFGNTFPRILGKQPFIKYQLDIYNYFKGNRYGGFFEGRRPVLYVLDPEIIKAVTISCSDHFTDRSTIRTKEPRYLSRSLLALKGSEWKAVRSLITPTFSSARLKNMFALIQHCSNQLVGLLTKFEKQLRKKWKNLRDQFRKEKKKFPTPRSGDGGDKIESTWPYFQLMNFINDDITPEVMTGNLNDSDSESLNESSQTEQYIADVTSPGTSTCSSRTNVSKRKSASDYRNQLLECERKKILLIERKMASNSDVTEKCDDFHFFMSLLPQMKKFSELQKLRIRNKITQVIIDETERMQFSQPRYGENYGDYPTGNYPNY